MKEKEWSEKLLEWYEANKRDLPWRHTKDPYRIWISEIMLQQTRVDTVIGYYERFLERFPTVESLAAGPIEDVLKCWEGLGYYSRARNLFKAAHQICEAGAFPGTLEEIRSLSGIGEYTSGSILSIAFNQKAAAVDGNVLRVIARLMASDRDIARGETRSWTAQQVLAASPESGESPGPSEYTQSLMELGACICFPHQPLCQICPLNSLCLAHQEGREEMLPVRSRPKEALEEDHAIALILRKNPETGETEALMHRRPDGLLGGLWEYPGVIASDIHELRARSADQWKVELTAEEPFMSYRHLFSHRHWRIQVFTANIPADEAEILVQSSEEWEWMSLKKQHEIMIPTAFRKILKKLDQFIKTGNISELH